MKPRIDELEAIVRTRICSVCSERTVEGVCGANTTRCSLFELFPLVAQAILATDSDRIEPYIQAIRENVCSVCVEQRLDGNCDLRDQVRCSLDAYLVPIVEAIEEATGKTFAS
jgi:hypothetical protein